jgi:hypothetical protein
MALERLPYGAGARLMVSEGKDSGNFKQSEISEKRSLHVNPSANKAS